MKEIMSEGIYQKIYETLDNILPQKWEKIVFTALYGEESYEMKYYADLGDGVMKDCFELSVVPKSQLIKTFIALNKIIAPERNVLEKKYIWNKMTLNISISGKFKAEFE